MNIYKVINQTPSLDIPRQDGSQTQKSTVILQELGNQYADSYAAALVGNQISFCPGDYVTAALRMTTHEYNGQYYQDCTIQDIRKLA